MSEAREFKYIGQNTIRPDGFDKVTGRAAYGADFGLHRGMAPNRQRRPSARVEVDDAQSRIIVANPVVVDLNGAA